MLPAWTEVAESLSAKIVPATPIKTGKLVTSTAPTVKPMRVRAIASAVNPKDGFNYAKIQHDGGRTGKGGRGYITGKKYMTGPLWATAPQVPVILNKEIAKIIAICGL